MASILIVDDEPDVVMALARALRIAGHTVAHASQTEKALALCAEHSFELVVLDYIMPTMTGIELLNQVRSYIPTIRSVIVSGKLDTQQGEETLTVELRERIEADIYLHKPVSNDRLLEAVADLLSREQEQSWTDIAERNVNAQKPKKTVKDAERSLNRVRRRPK